MDRMESDGARVGQDFHSKPNESERQKNIWLVFIFLSRIAIFHIFAIYE